MKVLFIGGTGRLSKDVASRAVDKGWEVYLLTRGKAERQLFVRKEYKMLCGDIRDVEKCRELLSGYSFDVVIDFLTFNTKQLEDTLKIIDGRYKQYIFISSATAYKKKDESEIISEASTAVGNEKWSYAYNKYLCEEYLKDYFKDRDSVYTVIRPYVTYGNTRVPYPIVPGKTTEEWTFVDRIENGMPIPVFDHGATVTTLTHTRDFAKGVVGLFCNDKAYGEAFHITSDKTVTWGQVIDELEKKLGKKAVRAEMTQDEIYRSMPMYKGILVGDKGTTMRFDSSKLRSAVDGFDCEVSLSEGIGEMVDFYNAHPELKKINYYWNGCIDRMCRAKKHGSFPNRRAKVEYYRGRYKLIDRLYRAMGKVKR